MRWVQLAVAALMLGGAAGRADAQSVLAGVYDGRYVCAQGTTGLTLLVRPAPDGSVRAFFHFYAHPSNPGVPEGCFEMAGNADATTRSMSLEAGAWRLRPPGYVTVDLNGQVGADGATVRGEVVGPLCGWFELRRTAETVGALPAACRPPADVVSSAEPPPITGR